MNWAALYKHKVTLVLLPIWVLATAAFFMLSAWLMPLPPSEITITTGPADGMYFSHAQRYAQILQKYGLDVTVQQSAGSGQNLQRLRDPKQPAQMAFIQGGFSALDNASASVEKRLRLLTVANVDIEPVWIFSKLKEIDSLQQLQGLRVSIGQNESGSRLVAIKLLDQVRIEPKDLVISETTGMGAVQALKNGTIDASIFVAAPAAPVVRAMLSTPGVYLVHLKRSAALSERIPYLEPRLIAAGMLDPVSKQPQQDTLLLSTVASVVVSEDLHPAIQRLVASVAVQVHSQAGPFAKIGDFPNLRHIDFPSSPHTRQVLTHGLPWLEKNLSLQRAQWAWRLLFIGLPLILLAWVICRLVPTYISWMIESHINRWYGELKYIEHDLEGTKLSGLDFSRHHTQLRTIETAASQFLAPQEFMKRLYILRHHIDFVRQKLLTKRGR